MIWERNPAVIADKLRGFFASAPHVRVIEDDAILLQWAQPGAGVSITADEHKAVMHVWSAERSLVRRIVQLRECPRALQLAVLRLGQSRTASLRLECASASSRRAPRRREFRERVLAAMRQSWPQWRPVPGKPSPLSAPDLEFFQLASRAGDCVCVAVPPDRPQAAVDNALTELLAWFGAPPGVLPAPPSAPPAFRLILPPGCGNAVQLRIAGLRARHRFGVFELDGSPPRLAPAPELHWANLESQLRRPADFGPIPPELVAPIAAQVLRHCPEAECVRAANGTICFRLHGLAFVRQAVGRDSLLSAFQFAAFDGEPPARLRYRPLLPETEAEFTRLLIRLGQERHPHGDPSRPLYNLYPEAWMEALLRRQFAAFDARCDPRFLYRQVPAFCQGHRDVLDLLAVHRDGRLCIFELKAQESLAFPLQALDYWLRVRRHLQEHDFSRLGFFPGLELRPVAPLLVLVAPALRWHARGTELLAWLDPEIPVLRLGLNEQWRQGMRIVQREERSTSPTS